jgi:hypothetical protein
LERLEQALARSQGLEAELAASEAEQKGLVKQRQLLQVGTLLLYCFSTATNILSPY